MAALGRARPGVGPAIGDDAGTLDVVCRRQLKSSRETTQAECSCPIVRQ